MTAGQPACPAAHLLAEDTWIHAHLPGARTFALVENLSRATSPQNGDTALSQSAALQAVFAAKDARSR